MRVWNVVQYLISDVIKIGCNVLQEREYKEAIEAFNEKNMEKIVFIWNEVFFEDLIPSRSTFLCL